MGGNHVLKDMYRKAAPYASRFLRTGRRVSVRLLWEIERDQITEVRRRLKAKNVDLKKWNTYALNNNFHALVAKHIISHRPDWAGMFEIRDRHHKPEVVERVEQDLMLA